MEKFVVVFMLFLGAAIVIAIVRVAKWKKPKGTISNQWRIILKDNVVFYKKLNQKNKNLFEFKVMEFLANVNIIGIKTNVTDTDKLLIAASAIIPIFSFPKWQYVNIDEVLLFPSSFNTKFEFDQGENRNILGMVGTGFMDGKMILSRKALEHGFSNNEDKKNTAIHEFVHLIDKMDGTIDGIPSVLVDNSFALPWIDMVYKEITKIKKGKSDINPYAGVNKAEFFAEISVYFFEQPKQLKIKHPKLYKELSNVFKTEGLSN